jgi:hypothetical protein
MTPVAIRESPQPHYPGYPGLLPPLPPTTNSFRSRRRRLLAPLAQLVPSGDEGSGRERSRNDGSAREGSPSTCSRLLASGNLPPTDCNPSPATCFSSPFVTAADYRPTTPFRYPFPFQLLRQDRGVGSITLVVAAGDFAAFSPCLRASVANWTPSVASVTFGPARHHLLRRLQ